MFKHPLSTRTFFTMLFFSLLSMPALAEKKDEKFDFSTRYQPSYFGLYLYGSGGYHFNPDLNSSIDRLTEVSAVQKEPPQSRANSNYGGGFSGHVRHYLKYIPGLDRLAIGGGLQMYWYEDAYTGLNPLASFSEYEEHSYTGLKNQVIFGMLWYNMYTDRNFGFNLGLGAGTNKVSFTQSKTVKGGTAKGYEVPYENTGLALMLGGDFEWKLFSFLSLNLNLQYLHALRQEFTATQNGRKYFLNETKKKIGDSSAPLVESQTWKGKSADMNLSGLQIQFGVSFWYW